MSEQHQADAAPGGRADADESDLPRSEAETSMSVAKGSGVYGGAAAAVNPLGAQPSETDAASARSGTRGQQPLQQPPQQSVVPQLLERVLQRGVPPSVPALRLPLKAHGKQPSYYVDDGSTAAEHPAADEVDMVSSKELNSARSSARQRLRVAGAGERGSAHGSASGLSSSMGGPPSVLAVPNEVPSMLDGGGGGGDAGTIGGAPAPSKGSEVPKYSSRESFMRRAVDVNELNVPRNVRYQLGTERKVFGVPSGESPARQTWDLPEGTEAAERDDGDEGGSTDGATRGGASSRRSSSLLGLEPMRTASKCTRCFTLRSVLDPLSTFMRYWDLSSLVALFFTSTVTPYEISFLETKINALFFVNRVVDLFFLCDIVVNFNLKFFDSQSGMWVKDRESIRARYLRTWFAVDVISFLPFDCISLMMSSDKLDSLRGLRLLRLLRLAKLLRILRAGRVLQRLESAFALDYVATTMARFLTLTALVCHWMACMWRFMVDIENAEFSWLDAYSNSLASRDAPELEHHASEYSAALYFSIKTLTSVGYGDLVPVTPSERYFACFLMILGAYFFGYIVGSITAILTARNERETHFFQLMDELNTFSETQHLPQELRAQLREYFRYVHQTADTETVHQLLNRMSPPLRNAVAKHINSGWITSVPFFQGIPQELCTELSMAMSSHTFAPMELVIQEGEYADQLHVVRKGVVAADGRILSASGLNVLGIDMIANRDGTMVRYYRATALTWSVVLSLDRATLQAILTNYPEVQDQMRSAALKHIFRTEVHAYVKANKWIEQGMRAPPAGLGVSGRAEFYFHKLISIQRNDEQEQELLTASAVTIQRYWRGFRCRSNQRRISSIFDAADYSDRSTMTVLEAIGGLRRELSTEISIIKSRTHQLERTSTANQSMLAALGSSQSSLTSSQAIESDVLTPGEYIRQIMEAIVELKEEVRELKVGSADGRKSYRGEDPASGSGVSRAQQLQASEDGSDDDGDLSPLARSVKKIAEIRPDLT